MHSNDILVEFSLFHGLLMGVQVRTRQLLQTQWGQVSDTNHSALGEVRLLEQEFFLVVS